MHYLQRCKLLWGGYWKLFIYDLVSIWYVNFVNSFVLWYICYIYCKVTLYDVYVYKWNQCVWYVYILFIFNDCFKKKLFKSKFKQQGCLSVFLSSQPRFLSKYLFDKSNLISFLQKLFIYFILSRLFMSIKGPQNYPLKVLENPKSCEYWFLVGTLYTVTSCNTCFWC